MDRLIDADKLFPYGSVPYYGDDGFRTAERIYEIIKKAPAVDAVEVVRCKNCFHCKHLLGARYCEVWKLFNGMGDEGFCNYGERKI